MSVNIDIEPLVMDLVEWVAREPRTYRDTMDAWRTSCPRLTVWEGAVEQRLVERVPVAGGEIVMASAIGKALLLAAGRTINSRA